MRALPATEITFFCTKAGAFLAYIGGPFQLDPLLHFCVSVQVAALTASFHHRLPHYHGKRLYHLAGQHTILCVCAHGYKIRKWCPTQWTAAG